MKILKSLLFQSVIASIFSSCVTHTPEEQEFKELANAENLHCASWQKDERTIGIEDLAQVGTSPFAFVAKTKQRDTSVKFHYQEFIEDQFVTEKTKYLRLDRDVRWLGPWQTTSHKNMVVLLDRETHIEIRKFPENKVIYRDIQERPSVFDEFIIQDGEGGFWFIYREDNDETKTRIERYTFDSSQDKITFQHFIVHDYEPDLENDRFLHLNSSLFIFSFSSQNGKPHLSYRTLDKTGVLHPPHSFPIPIKSRLDKWTLIATGEHEFMIAMIDGDPFLRHSVLRIGRFRHHKEGRVETKWVKTRSLMNFHVSNPIWLKRNEQFVILLSKWLDEKSTLAQYVVSSKDVQGAGHVGQFPKAARLSSVYKTTSQDSPYFIVRTKEKVGWAYQVCKLD